VGPLKKENTYLKGVVGYMKNYKARRASANSREHKRFRSSD